MARRCPCWHGTISAGSDERLAIVVPLFGPSCQGRCWRFRTQFKPAAQSRGPERSDWPPTKARFDEPPILVGEGYGLVGGIGSAWDGTAPQP